MTRTISATLLAAAQSLHGVPCIECAIANTRARYQIKHEGAGSAACQTAMVQDDTTGGIIRAIVDASGNVRTCVVSSPNTAAQADWSNWTTTETDGHPSGDVALARLANKQYRLFYVGNTGNVIVKTSTNGTAWGSKATVLSADVGTRIAAGGEYLVIQYNSKVSYYVAAWSAAWSAAVDWSGVTPSNRYGVGADYRSTSNRLYIVSAQDGHILFGWRDLTAGTWSGPYYAAPGGGQATPAGAASRDPDVLVTPSNIIATWIARQNTSPWDWTQAVVRRSYDWEHFGDETALDTTVTTQARVAMCKEQDVNRIWIADEDNVLYSDDFLTTTTSRYTSDLTVQYYERNQPAGRPGKLSLTLLDATAELTSLATRSLSQPLLPLAEVRLSRGYTTSAGDETEQLEPYYITNVGYGAGRNAGKVFITAVDGFGLLDLVIPREPIYYYSRSFAWLLAEVLATVGLGYDDDGDAAFARTVSTFVLQPNRTLLTTLGYLLRLAGAVAFFQADGSLYCRNLAGYAPASPADVGDQSEILAARLGSSVPSWTVAHAAGSGNADANEDATLSMELGLRLFWRSYDERIGSDSVAAETAARQIALAAASRRLDTARIPLRPDLEPWDLINLEGSAALLPAGSRDRSILGIAERMQPRAGIYATTLELGDSYSA